jgi:hypothetical protein
METETASGGYGLRQGEGEARWWLGGLATLKATGKETDGRYTLVEVMEPDGAEAPLHVHHREDEGFLDPRGRGDLPHRERYDECGAGVGDSR